MRITIKIASSGASRLHRFPVAKYSIDECKNAGKGLDLVKVRQSLSVDGVQIADKDDMPVFAFALAYLSQQQSVLSHLAEKLNKEGDCSAGVHEVGIRDESATPSDLRCLRRMNKDQVAYVRTDVTGCADGIHAKLSVMNPREVVGNTIFHAHDCAVLCARILIYLREAITTAPVVLLEGEGASGIYAEAEAMNRRDDFEKKRKTCPSHRNGFCSPSNPDCPYYAVGRCQPPT